MAFKKLNIITPILKAIEARGYTQPSPIQEQSIPILLTGRDLLGCAQTGTGKTAAFAIPIIQQIHQNYPSKRQRGRIRALIVTPTRELAIQVSDNFKIYAKETNLRTTVIFGGVNQNPQVRALQSGCDILVATPGRLLDLINQGVMHLNDIEHFVLDEADQMLDMGFVHDINRMLKLLPPKSERQSLFFSATMPNEIRTLADTILHNPQKVTINPEKPTADRVEQKVYHVEKKEKPELLIHLLENMDADSVIVFSRTKHGADKVVRKLDKANITSAAIHGNKSQNNRQKALEGFKSGTIRVLVATDIAARGIDVKELKLVVNFDLPNIAETYVHRIGRTGRANASGLAISFCDAEEFAYLKDIQKLIGRTIPLVDDQPFHLHDIKNAEIPPKATKERRNSRPKAAPKGQNKRSGKSKQSGSSSNGQRSQNSPKDQKPRKFKRRRSE